MFLIYFLVRLKQALPQARLQRVRFVFSVLPTPSPAPQVPPLPQEGEGLWVKKTLGKITLAKFPFGQKGCPEDFRGGVGLNAPKVNGSEEGNTPTSGATARQAVMPPCDASIH